MTQPCQASTLERTQAIPELRRVMLNVPNRNDLMLEFAACVPGKSAVRLEQVKAFNRSIDHAVTQRAECQQLRPRVRFGHQWQRASSFVRAGKSVLVLHVRLTFRPRLKFAECSVG